MSDGAEYCGKSGEIKEKREYLEAESRGLAFRQVGSCGDF